MDDARCNKDRQHVRIVRRRDGLRELETQRPLDSMDAAFAAIAQLSLAR